MRQQARSLSTEPDDKAEGSARRELIVERDGKSLYQSDKPDLLIQEFGSPEPSNVNKFKKKRSVGSIRNEISCYLFEYLEGFHIPTCFVGKLSSSQMMIKRVDLFPLSVKVFNSPSEALAGRLGITQKTNLDFPIIEHYYASGKANSSWVNEYHVYALDVATPEEFKGINRLTAKVNAVLRGLCDRRQLALSDLHLTFGRWKAQIVLADELSPTNCHFLDLAKEDPSQRDRFQVDSPNSEEALSELCDRLMLKV